MRTLLALLLAVSAADAETFDYQVTIVEVIDGDTVKAINPAWPEPLQDISIRVLGIDTPEKGGRASCEQEALLGQVATDYAKQVLPEGMTVKVTYDTENKDKFGRLLSDITLPNGITYSQLMIENGYARPYDGGTKSDWCE